ncbi:MAG TPA: L,D-transpeptidase [Armatimonadota bacterium]|nr:L,D-transpeptidase [Armatimonadota bacterium]
MADGPLTTDSNAILLEQQRLRELQAQKRQQNWRLLAKAVAILGMFIIGWIACGLLLHANTKHSMAMPNQSQTSYGDSLNSIPGSDQAPTSGIVVDTDNDSRIPRVGEKVGFIVVNKSSHTLIGYDNESNRKLIAGPWRCTTGLNSVNKTRIGDRCTPEGRHIIVSVEDSRDRVFDGEYAYGPWFLRLRGLEETNKGWQGIAIHGHAPGREDELGTNASHGCIRISNENIKLLKDAVVPGQTIVDICH